MTYIDNVNKIRLLYNPEGLILAIWDKGPAVFKGSSIIEHFDTKEEVDGYIIEKGLILREETTENE
tara:strand:+ start:142 stop:339 length:198 start_codon:yes stop_codon:yes gene_type:complete